MIQEFEPEIIVVGKGFAGLTLSFLLQKSGVPHLVLGRKEKESRVLLGETLPPSAMGVLAGLGLKELFEAHALQKTHGYHSVWGSPRRTDRHFFSLRPFQNGLKLNRNSLLQAMENEVAAHVMDCKGAVEVLASEAGIEVKFRENGQPRSLCPRLIVDATGRKRHVLKQLGIGILEKDSLLAFSCHVEVVKPPPLVHGVLVESFARGWGIASKIARNRFALSLFSKPASNAEDSLKNYANWSEVLSQTTVLKEFLAPAPLGPVVGAHANSSCAARIAGTNWLAVGDAALAYDPLSSHGISNALYGAKQAHAAILESRDTSRQQLVLQGYGQKLRGIFNAYLQEKNGLYGQENRWKSQNFWRERV